MSDPVTLDPARHQEAALINAALDGDGRAFRALVEPHLPMLYRIAARVSGQKELAEDAVQETMLLAFKNLPGWRPEAPFKAFLASIAARQAHTLVRSERRRHKRETLHPAAPQAVATPEEQLQGTNAAERVRRIIAAMPRKRREVLLLRLDAGLDYKEIATVMNTTTSSARVLVHLGLKDLRARLAKEEGS